MIKNKRITRNVGFDILRIVSIVALVILHVSNNRWGVTAVNSKDFEVFNFFNSWVRWCVPVFVMVSGALLLNPKKEITIKKLYKKNIFHLLYIYIIWYVIYALLRASIDIKSLNPFPISNTISIIHKEMLIEHYHLWFLPMLIGLYAITPLLRIFIDNAKDTTRNYILILILVVAFIIPNITAFPFLPNIINVVLSKVQIPFLGIYLGYYILGYYLSTLRVSNKDIKHLILLFVVSGILCFFVTQYLSIATETRFTFYYSNTSVFTFLQSVAIFLLCNYIGKHIYNKKRIVAVVITLSSLALGVYLSHDIVIVFLSFLGIDTLSFNSIISVPIISFIVLIVSTVGVYVLSKIKWIKGMVL